MGQYLYLAVEFLQQKHTGLELFLGFSSGEPTALHVSSALATRVHGPNGWSSHEWRAEQWGANVIGTISDGGGMRFLEPDGFEVQVSKALLRGQDLFVRIELKRLALVLRPGSSDHEPRSWIHLTL